MKKFISNHLGELLIVISLFLTLLLILNLTNQSEKSKKIRREKQEYKDSLETEYYKKMLKSYPYEHSKITDSTMKTY
jgi:hypothetical protein